jgi:hypothetical protein
VRGTATYDSTAHSLTVTLLDDENGGRPRQTLAFAHDIRAQTLTVVLGKAPEVFKRRRDQVPDTVVKDIAAAKSRAQRQP